MAILTPEHLFAQADGLLALHPGRKPRQTEIRRAISASYYGVFHFILAQAADMYVGARHRKQPRYALAYRSISHAGLRSLCEAVSKSGTPRKFVPYLPESGFAADLRKIATSVQDLQDMRHEADYDPLVSFVRTDALSQLASARDAVVRFRTVAASQRQIFLALLLFPPRGKG